MTLEPVLVIFYHTASRQGNLACCSPWGCRESDVTYRLNDNNWKTLAGFNLLDNSQGAFRKDTKWSLGLLKGWCESPNLSPSSSLRIVEKNKRRH